MKLLSFLFTFVALSAFAQNFPAEGYYDRTNVIMLEESGKGLELIAEKEIQGIHVKLHLNDSSKLTIKNGTFLVADPEYNQEKLNNFIFEAFETSLAYFHQIDPNDEVKEINLILVDKGGDRGTISEVPVHSRVMELHLVRWHKYYKKNQKSYVNLSSIHEFGHVVNYMYSPKEVKLHREMTGVLVECLNLIQLYGFETFKLSYLKTFAGTVPDLTQISSDAYTNMSVIRNTVFVLFKNLYAETYSRPPETDVRKISEELVMNYLMNPLDATAGLDDSLARTGLLDASGKTLTFETLRSDTLKELSPPEPEVVAEETISPSLSSLSE